MDASLHYYVLTIFCKENRIISSIDRCEVSSHGRLCFTTTMILLGFFKQSFETVKTSLSIESVILLLKLRFQFADSLVLIVLVGVPLSH